MVIFDKLSNSSNVWVEVNFGWPPLSSSSTSSLLSQNREYHQKLLISSEPHSHKPSAPNTGVSAADRLALKQNFMATLSSSVIILSMSLSYVFSPLNSPTIILCSQSVHWLGLWARSPRKEGRKTDSVHNWRALSTVAKQPGCESNCLFSWNGEVKNAQHKVVPILDCMGPTLYFYQNFICSHFQHWFWNVLPKSMWHIVHIWLREG